jgi:type III secretion system needle length determinant
LGPDDPGPEGKRQSVRAKDEKRAGEPAGEEDNREKGQGSQVMPSASSLLSSLFESRMSAVAAPPPPAAGKLDDLVDDLVQRILVSDPQSGAPAEIRLQLNDSILADTRISVSRGPDGLLSVLLETGNASSLQTLVSAQQSLREQLAVHGPVNVRINNAQESGQGDNDARRRSQGLVEYGPENLY